MKRKLVKQGAATLMVSLPAKWLKEFNLGKGDEVDIDEADNSLVITKQGIAKKKETEISITKEVETGIRTLIINSYRTGYDLVKVNFLNEKQFKIIKECLRDYLIGFDITTKGKNSCTIENITEPSAEQFDVIINKMIFNTKEVIELTKDRLNGKKIESDYIENSLRMHQYGSFCRRVITKKQREIKEPYLFWTFLTIFTHGERNLYHLNKFLDKNQVKASKETLSLFDDLSNMFDLIVKAYRKKEIQLLEEVHFLEKDIIYQKGYKLMSTKKGKENIAIYHLLNSIRNFYLSTSPLMGLLLGEKKGIV